MFGLAGRNKAVKAEPLENQKRPLRSLVEDTTEEEWNRVHRAEAIEPSEDFKVKLRSAMRLLPGPVRNNSHWEDVLGHERPRSGIAAPNAVSTNAAATATLARQSHGAVRPPVRTQPDISRPRRSGKRRSYGDSSFEGYGDGFEDDEFDEYGTRLDEDDEAFARKKRKKVQCQWWQD